MIFLLSYRYAWRIFNGNIIVIYIVWQLHASDSYVTELPLVSRIFLAAVNVQQSFHSLAVVRTGWVFIIK